MIKLLGLSAILSIVWLRILSQFGFSILFQVAKLIPEAVAPGWQLKSCQRVNEALR